MLFSHRFVLKLSTSLKLKLHFFSNALFQQVKMHREQLVFVFVSLVENIIKVASSVGILEWSRKICSESEITKSKILGLNFFIQFLIKTTFQYKLLWAFL